MIRIMLILLAIAMIVAVIDIVEKTSCINKIKSLFIYKYKREANFRKWEHMYCTNYEITKYTRWICRRILDDKELDEYERTVIDNCVAFIENLPQTLPTDKMESSVLESLSQCKKLLSEYDEANVIALKQSFGLLPEDDTVEVELPQNITNALEYFEYIERSENNTKKKESVAEED